MTTVDHVGFHGYCVYCCIHYEITPLRFYLFLPSVHILFVPVIARTSALVAVTRSAEDEGNLYSISIARQVKAKIMVTFIMFAK
jgi:hypothetical protein